METAATPPDRWPLPRVLILILAGAFVGLMADIRVEHVDVVHEHTVGWLPIIYSAFMTLASILAVACWSKITRAVMLPLFLLAFVVGGIGFYFHNHGKFQEVVQTSLHAWTDPKMSHPNSPPQLAPLAFAGLGAIGVLASHRRFNS